MDGLLNNLQLENNRKNILNAENGLTFCIQVGEENLSLTCAEPVKSTCIEPTISVLESEEEDFLSIHEIDADTIKETHKVNGKRKMKGSESLMKNRQIHHSLQENCVLNNNNSTFNIKIKNQRSKNKGENFLKSSTNSNDVTSVILQNLRQSQSTSYLGLKLKINPETNKLLMQSSYKKSNGIESFTVEPWMNEVPKVLQNPKNQVFLLKKEKSENSVSKSTSFLSSSVDSSDMSSISLDTDNNLCPRQLVQLIKDEKGELRGNYEPGDCGNSRIIYWEEGNADKVTDYISLSEMVRSAYAKSKKVENDGVDFFTDYLGNIQTYESPSITKSGAAPGTSVFMSWEAVKERMEEIQEKTMTRFVVDYKTPHFKDDPAPFKKIYFELDTKRKDVDVVIPNKGIPFMFLGVCFYTCHLGKRRSSNNHFIQDDMSRGLRTKKIGCPACFSIFRIARFPDFGIRDLNPKCQEKVLQEVRDAWDMKTSRVRYYIEYHVKEPKDSDHKGHEVLYLTNNNRFNEPVDPRILEKVRSLIREGYCKLKTIQEKVREFVKEELFKGEELPSPSRRRYNPSERDIRYGMFKAREELKKEGKNMLQLECSALAREISECVKNISQDEYLQHIKSCLMYLFKAIRGKEPLEPMFMGNNNLDINNLLVPAATSSPYKRVTKKRKAEDATNLIPAAEPTKDNLLEETDHIPDQFDDQAIDQFIVGVADATDNTFCAQMFDINSGLVDGLQPAADDGIVYYYYSDTTGTDTCELPNSESLGNGQT